MNCLTLQRLQTPSESIEVAPLIIPDNVPGTGEAFHNQVSGLGVADVARHAHRARQAKALQVGIVMYKEENDGLYVVG